ncbi:MAG: hypothetical protein BWY78_00728 [Alphaproteobacteria bacterium ADurb.Bin438]|nr:MAG: hypothetical protein BWY78_00728 [Alphaproteobacteria bacterium ADurb.Bin438]
MYDQDKEKFHNMSFIEISKFAYEMTTKNCINFEEFEKEVKSLEKKEKTELFNNALKQREEFFKENGLSEEENLKRWNDFLSYKPKKEDLGTKLKNSIKKEFKRWLLTHPVVKYTKLKEILDKKLNNDNKSNVTRNFKKRIAKEMVEKNKSYERAMLDLYKERAKYDTSYYFNSLAAKDTYETMHDIIINNKDKFKEDIFTSQNAFGAQFNKIEISEDVKEAKGQKGLELYTNHKNEYRKILKSVIKSVRKGNITEEVKQDFKKSLYHAKQYITLSKNLSVEIDEGKLNVDKRLAHFIKKDSKNLYPKELNKMFKNKKPVMIMNFASKQR